MGKRYAPKFPMARIKRMMQADPDVGKIATATPILISKALEMFIETFVKAAVKEAQDRNHRKLSAGHLKACILNTERLDFLKDLVEKIADLTSQVSTDSSEAPVKKRSGRATGDHSAASESKLDLTEERKENENHQDKPKQKRAKKAHKDIHEEEKGAENSTAAEESQRSGTLDSKTTDVSCTHPVSDVKNNIIDSKTSPLSDKILKNTGNMVLYPLVKEVTNYDDDIDDEHDQITQLPSKSMENASNANCKAETNDKKDMKLIDGFEPVLLTEIKNELNTELKE